MLQTEVVEKIKTHILCSVTSFFENRAVDEIMWKNIIEPDRPQMTIWRMRSAFWIPKATYTRSEYVIFIAFPRQQWLRESASMLHYTHIAYLIFYFHPYANVTYINFSCLCSSNKVGTAEICFYNHSFFFRSFFLPSFHSFCIFFFSFSLNKML
jgi:hypothetical protein